MCRKLCSFLTAWIKTVMSLCAKLSSTSEGYGLHNHKRWRRGRKGECLYAGRSNGFLEYIKCVIPNFTFFTICTFLFLLLLCCRLRRGLLTAAVKVANASVSPAQGAHLRASSRAACFGCESSPFPLAHCDPCQLK